MRRATIILPLAIAIAGVVSGCEASNNSDAGVYAPLYGAVQTRLLEGDLVQFEVAMKGARGNDDVTAYAECAAAQYTLIRGYGFARHLRTNVTEQAGQWRGDAIYTISAQLPRGSRKIDAEIVVAACAENGIPTV